MNYFLIAMIVSFLSVCLTGIIGSFFADSSYRNVKSTVGWSFFWSVIYGLFLWGCYWFSVPGFYGPLPYLLSVCGGAIIGAIIAYCSNEEESSGSIPGIVVVVGYLVVALCIWFFGTSDIFHSKKMASLIGEVKMVKTIEESIKPADVSHICLVSESMARVAAQNALSKFKVEGNVIPGSRYQIGTPTKQYVDGQLWWIFPLEFTGYFKWNQSPMVPGYLRVSAENPFEEGQSVQIDKPGKDIKIKYLNSACFDNKAIRYLRQNGYAHAILDDWTFEVDDNWKPYYTVSVLERTIGYSGLKVKGIVLLDLQTGDFKFYSVNKVPKWIDRVVPLDVIDQNIKSWGSYANSTWGENFWHNDKAQAPTEGWFMVYDTAGECSWFSGFTSVNSSDHALTGFVTIDSRTGQTKFTSTTGVTESIAKQTAKSLWSNFADYEPTELIPYNLYGVLTYVIPMEYNGQYKGVSLVSTRNTNIAAKGEKLEDALANYRVALVQASSGDMRPFSQSSKTVEIKGIIERKGEPLNLGKDQIFLFTLKGVSKIFQASYSYANPKIAVARPGDYVVITYQDTPEPIITVKTFDVPAIVLSANSPDQIRYLENQKTVKQETGRVDNNQKRQDLLNSDDMKNVDPNALQEFIKQQKKK